MPEPSGAHHWFEPIADFLGPAYLRYSFTKGTEQEADFLVDHLALSQGSRVLDVGCGPGRHAHALARRGMAVTGVDISHSFCVLARGGGVDGSAFAQSDARRLPVRPGAFDLAIALCQGGFGLLGLEGGDATVLSEMAATLRPGGRLVISAFSAHFVVRFPEEGHTFDPATGVHHEVTTLKNEAGAEQQAELWTTCYTPRELALLAEASGLRADAVYSVTPGAYAPNAPSLDSPEYLLVATKP